MPRSRPDEKKDPDPAAKRRVRAWRFRIDGMNARPYSPKNFSWIAFTARSASARAMTAESLISLEEII